MWPSRLRPVERAAASIAAAGAMRSCVHPSCEVSIPGTRSPVQVSIPGGHVATVRQRLRPMSPALGRDQWQPTGDCRGHRRVLHRSRIYIYRASFYYFTEVVSLTCRRVVSGSSRRVACGGGCRPPAAQRGGSSGLEPMARVQDDVRCTGFDHASCARHALAARFLRWSAQPWLS
mgnify:CR=1 FL=1